MFQRRPTSRFLLFTLISLLLLLLLTSTMANEDPATETSNDEDSELLELIEIDELEGNEGGEGKERQQLQEQKEAEVVSKAQRIVLELNSDNVKRVVDGNEYVMVLGYAPWCGRSAELMPQFAEAANKLKELGSAVLMAKLDAERYPKAASELGIKGFPTLLLFVNGSSQVYTGGFTGADIVIWARKKSGCPVVRITSVMEAEEFLKNYQIFVLGLFDKFEGPPYGEFINAAATENEIQFAEVKSLVAARVLFPEVQDPNLFMGLVKSEPERYTKYEGDFKMEKILQFVDHNKFPLVTRLTDLNSARVYSSPIKLQVTVFADTDDLKNLINPLQEVAKKFKSKMLFIYVDIADENLAKPFLTLFGLESAEDTVVTAFDNRIISKYLLEMDPTPSNIEEFCSGLLHGSLSPYYKSQAVPDNKEASVQVIVGKTFDDLVLNNPKNFVLESLTVNNFYVGEGTDFSGVPTKMLTVNGSLRMSVYNPATIFGIHVSSSPINLVYSEIVVATGQLKKYYQPRKSHRIVSVVVEGDKVPLYGAGSSLTVSQTGIVVPLTLKFEIKSREYEVGKLVRTNHRKLITCPVVIDSTSSKPIKFKKDSCTYK